MFAGWRPPLFRRRSPLHFSASYAKHFENAWAHCGNATSTTNQRRPSRIGRRPCRPTIFASRGMIPRRNDDEADVVLHTPFYPAATAGMTLLYVCFFGFVLFAPNVKDRYDGLWFAISIYLAFLAVAWFYNLRVSFYRDRLVVQRGFRVLQHTKAVAYESIGRARTTYSWRPAVTLDLRNGKRLRIADEMSRVVGVLPEVDFKEGESTEASTRIRRIAALVDQRIGPRNAA